jgi:hypothetical protein
MPGSASVDPWKTWQFVTATRKFCGYISLKPVSDHLVECIHNYRTIGHLEYITLSSTFQSVKFVTKTLHFDIVRPDKVWWLKIIQQPAKVLLWLATSDYGVSKSVFFKFDYASIRNCTFPNDCQYFISLSKNTTKEKNCVLNFYLIQRLYTTWTRLEDLKIEYVTKEENPPNFSQLRLSENF